MDARYSVFVGGIEVNDYYLTYGEAEDLADEYWADGYDDVQIVDMEDEIYDY